MSEDNEKQEQVDKEDLNVEIEAEEISEPEEETVPDPVVKHEGKFYGTGRRKNSVARVWITAGTGKFEVDGSSLEDYFDGRRRWVSEPLKPLEELEFEDKIDVTANAKGGGKTGQAEAIKLGVARALVDMDENARKPLHAEGHLTRDERNVERKKVNQPGARAKAQVSKR